MALVALVGAACTFAPRQLLQVRAAPVVGWLHTDGIHILDERDHVVRLVGVNVHGLEPGAGTRAAHLRGQPRCFGWTEPAPDVAANIARWGFNSVRVPISWANLEPRPPSRGPGGRPVHTYNRAYLAALDQVVADFRARGLAVVLDMHQNKWTPAFRRTRGGFVGPCPGTGLPVWLYRGTGITNVAAARFAFYADHGGVQESLASAWRFLAARYADDPTVVALDLFNEPYAGSGLTPAALHLDRLYDLLGAAIRSVNTRALLVFEDSQDSFDGDFALSRPPPFAGVVYSFHLYRQNWDPLGLRVVRDFTNRSDGWRVPAWIGEFNAFGATTNGDGGLPAGWDASTRGMLAYTKINDIGWAVWAYSGASSLVVPGTQQPKLQVVAVLQRGL